MTPVFIQSFEVNTFDNISGAYFIIFVNIITKGVLYNSTKKQSK